MSLSTQFMSANWLHEDKERRDKWAYMTEGYEDIERRILEVMLENQHKVGHMVASQRAGISGGIAAVERTLTTDIQTFITGSFPIVRCLYPKLCTDLYSVQPISQIAAYLFYLDVLYENAGMYDAGTDTCDDTDCDYGVVGEKEDVKGMKLRITGELVEAECRKLLADYSVEAQLKLISQFGINAESELMTAMVDEHAREINCTILNDMVTNAGAGNVNWNYTTPTAAPWNVLDPKAYAATLYDAICDANNLIRSNIYRNATFMVARSNVINRLEKLETYTIENIQGQSADVGILRVGTLDKRWTVCMADDSFPANTILLGYKGPTWKETAYVYAPYLTFWSTDLWVDPRTFDNYRGTMSCVANKMVRPNAFATVSLIP